MYFTDLHAIQIMTLLWFIFYFIRRSQRMWPSLSCIYYSVFTCSWKFIKAVIHYFILWWGYRCFPENKNGVFIFSRFKKVLVETSENLFGSEFIRPRMMSSLYLPVKRHDVTWDKSERTKCKQNQTKTNTIWSRFYNVLNVNCKHTKK